MKRKTRNKRDVPLWMPIAEVVLCILFLFLSIWWFGASYPEFDKIAARGARIPGLGVLSPQGLCVLPEQSGYDFAMSGYAKGKPSRVYLIGDETDAPERYVTFTENGKPIETHFGGVTASDSDLYIASGNKIVRASLGDVLAAQNGAAVEIKDSFSTGMGNAYCYLFGDRLFVGEFYRRGNYETDVSHHIETDEGTHRAFVYEYALGENGAVASPEPVAILSVCDEVQGIAVTENKIYLSCSYGLPDSVLRVYDDPLSDADGDVGGVPLYILQGGKTMRLPCMSEEICISGNDLVILFESMSKKYRFFTRSRIADLRSVPLSAL